MNRSPDFLIVGAAKSGTTSLSNYLAQHPDIKVVSNRLEYFGEYSNQMMPILSESEYLNLFKDIPSRITAGEKSVSYLYSNRAPKEIHAMNDQMKILIILRNPVDRAYSDYWHRRRNGMETLSFKKALEQEEQRIRDGYPFEQHYATYGLYASKVQNYLHLFGSNQCNVFLFNDLIENPARVCKECFNFLGVDSKIADIHFGTHNKGGTPKENIVAKLLFKLSRNRAFMRFARTLIPTALKNKITSWMNTNDSEEYPDMDPNIRAKLLEFYADDIKKLQQLINRDLSHWLDD